MLAASRRLLAPVGLPAARWPSMARTLCSAASGSSSSTSGASQPPAEDPASMVLCNVDTDGFATVTLNRPDVFNAFSGACTALHVRHPPGKQHALINFIFSETPWWLWGTGAWVVRVCRTDVVDGSSTATVAVGAPSNARPPCPHLSRNCVLSLCC